MWSGGEGLGEKDAGGMFWHALFESLQVFENPDTSSGMFPVLIVEAGSLGQLHKYGDNAAEEDQRDDCYSTQGPPRLVRDAACWGLRQRVGEWTRSRLREFALELENCWRWS